MNRKLRIISSIIGICIGIFIIFIVQDYIPTKKQSSNIPPTLRKLVLVLTSSGGRGHISAAESLQEYLGDSYEVRVLFPLREILGNLDFIATITGSKYYSEELYNYFLTRQQFTMIKPMVWAGKIFYSLRAKSIERLFYNYIESTNPAMIISVIPYINGAVALATNKKNIPFWVIPTDLDSELFIYQLHLPKGKSFLFNCAYNKNAIKKTIAPARLRATQYTYAGFPVREQFLQQYDAPAIRNKYTIPTEKPIIMLMMGGRGSKELIKLVSMLTSLPKPVHLLICIGSQEDIRKPLEALEKAPGITMSIIGFTKHVAELMAISNLFITKSGGASVNEALYMELPMLIDATVPALEWERLNRTFVENIGAGKCIKHASELVPTIVQLLEHPEILAQWKKNIQQLEKPNPRDYIRKKIFELIGQ
jgi:processive 1,2-diacylglycerol beta-glucosyltransferase